MNDSTHYALLYSIEEFAASAVEQLRRSAVDESWAVDAELLLRMSTQSCLERLSEHRQQQTPLSGKSYVISGEQVLRNYARYLLSQLCRC